MSGEAYGNLWLKDPDELCHAQSDLERMADRLAGLGHADAAEETYAILADVRAQDARLRASLRRLSDVWRAVDYWDSSDAGPEPVTKAITEYRTGDPRGPHAAQQDAVAADVAWDASTNPRTVREALAGQPHDFGRTTPDGDAIAEDYHSRAARTVPELLADYQGGLE